MNASTKPYFIRALHEWCSDQGFTPYLAVWVDSRVNVPMAYVRNNEIVLNIADSATRDLTINNDAIYFSARFSGMVHEVYVPIANVISLFARETGEGMHFDVEPLAEGNDAPHAAEATALHLASAEQETSNDEEEDDDPPPSRHRGRPQLRVVK